MGVFFLYAVGVEVIELCTVSQMVPQTVEAWGTLENRVGRWADGALGRLLTSGGHVMRRNAMTGKQRFRLLTPEGLTTHETFVLAEQQPAAVKGGCLLLVHEASGRLLTAHEARLIPVAHQSVPAGDQRHKSPCVKCGRVEGIILDEVACPVHGRSGCGLLEPEE